MHTNSTVRHTPFYLVLLVLLTALAGPQPSLALEKTYRNTIGMTFVLIPAGTFVMGSPENEAGRDRHGGEEQHTVTLTKPIYMQSTEVTVDQWESIMGKPLIGWRRGAGNMPVTRVSWNDCQKFIEKLNARGEGVYRLPTEAEWEYACRAGTQTPFSWGDKIECDKAMYGNKKGSGACLQYLHTLKLDAGKPAPVKTFAPNAWGLYDMQGNVWEWCQDWYGDYDLEPVKDPTGPSEGNHRVRRGGGWASKWYDLRSANRAYSHPSNRIKIIGFRVAREAL
ncbi:MAG: formylglycine-generating enzyme family protein [Deltaproteobacteria bacterium]|nr:formylglycine-generating enzyme family protein [Deltaproteobacteria bacterium]